ncbi:MAG: AAA family ATPase [Candidatus Heimdallarchaeota archaeon]|nr:AAA family ATPase [Candidatus Heimdallarchaeota archaeon]MCK4954861.1 AAA family ATPase [Candidatus Heimdallarchaeota archaeon]
MKIIVLSGLPLSGKTTYAKKIGPDYNMPLYETGTEVLEEVTGRGLDFTPDNIKMVTDECKKISDSYFTERLMKKVDTLPADILGVFISGIRAVSEIEILKKHYGNDNVFVIAFHTSMKSRFNRLNNPDRVEDTKGAKAEEDKLLRNFDNFLARNKKELGYGVGDVIALADYMMSTENEIWPYVTVEKNAIDFEIIIKEILK